MLEKGIIVTPDFTFDGITLKINGLSGQTMRQCLLYWDKIEFPTSNIINFKTPPEFQILINEKILQRTDIRLTNFSGNVGYAHILTQLGALQLLNQKEPGQWSIGQSSNSLYLSDQNVENKNILEFELHRCMPIPTSDIPFEDILEFKYRRQDEYIAFKNYICDLYLEIINSNDIPRSKNQAINKIKYAIEDIDKVSSESFVKRVFKSLSLNINPANMATHGLAGMGLAPVFGMPVELGAAAGSILGAINFNITKQPIPSIITREQKGLAYLFQAKEHLVRKVGRNELCPCGSGKKYKKCCLK